MHIRIISYTYHVYTYSDALKPKSVHATHSPVRRAIAIPSAQMLRVLSGSIECVSAIITLPDWHTCVKAQIYTLLRTTTTL